MAYDRLRYDEPPLWFYPVRQSLAAALLRFGQAAEAERVVREGLSGQRRDPRMQFVLWQALERQGKAREAALVAAEFRAVWKGPELPRLEDL